MTNSKETLFTTNGMFIIDEIVNKNTGERLTDIVGGGGTFAALGATIVGTANLNFQHGTVSCSENNVSSTSEKIKFIVDCGSDFPYETVQPQLDAWGIGIIYRKDNSRLTTRGYNEYGPGDFRTFKYQTPKKLVLGQDFMQTIEGPIAIMHLVCSAKRAVEIIEALRVESTLVDGEFTYKCKKFVWEPVPDLCTLEYYKEIHAVLNQYAGDGVEVILSPNAEEAFQLFYGIDVIEPTVQECITKLQSKIHQLSPFPVVIRCGALGCILFNQGDKNGKESTPQVLPAYHQNTQDEVKDPTGGGNTFLGGFAMGLALSRGDFYQACICGNIVSGVVIEQNGLPVLNKTAQPGVYLWNGKSFAQRWNRYMKTYLNN
ncbi:hypothetical protein ACO0QE_004028 [Hanseniaspora vineae]